MHIEREMKAPIASIALILIFYNLCLLQVNSQKDSCNSNLNLNDQLKFNTSSLICNPVWSAQDFILRYEQAGPDLWSFLLSAPNKNAYVAIGFSRDGNMVGSSAVVGWIDSNGTAIVKEYYLGGQTPSQVEVDKGNLTIVTNSSSIISVSSRIFMGFQLNTNKPERRLLYAVGPTGVFPRTSNQLMGHDNRISTTLNYLTAGVGQIGKNKTASTEFHGLISIVGWGILMPVGAIAARYCKQWNPLWYYAHISLQSVGFVFGIVSIVSGFVLENKLSVDVKAHKGLGIFMIVLACLQMLAFVARPDKDSKYRKYWNWYHYIVGRLLILLAVVNIFYGIHLGQVARSTWNIGYAVILVLISIVAIILEIKLFMSK